MMKWVHMFMLGDMYNFSVADAKTAEDYVDLVILANDGYLEIGEQEEVQFGGHTIHCFRLNEKESGGHMCMP